MKRFFLSAGPARACCISVAIALVSLFAGSSAMAREHINIVGSSTVYPFAEAIAERFGQTTKYKTPKIESTGSGGGLKLFCEGLGLNTPDITNASRRIKQSEIDKCRNNDVKNIIEVKLGYDGIVIARSKKMSSMDLTLQDVFLALAKDVPDPSGAEKLVANPYKKWSDVNSRLPAIDIKVLGPPPTSGTRDAFVELALEGGCKTYSWLHAIKKTDKKRYMAICRSVREDGAFIDAGENDNLIVRKLIVNPNMLGIFGYSFLEQNADTLHGVTIDGVAPKFEAIAEGTYPVSRSLFFYVKKDHIGVVPGIMAYVEEALRDSTSSLTGYLVDKGLIPMSDEERQALIPPILSQSVLSAKL